MHIENLILFIVVLLVLLFVVVVQTVTKIKRARAVGKKLSKRNMFYAVVTKLFVKDLPN